MARSTRAPVSPDRAAAKTILDELWRSVLDDETTRSTPKIRCLVDSNQVAIRFCLPTQLPGKLTDPTLDTMCLQRGGDGDREGGRWDPRGFAVSVIVPWNQSNQTVLGTSGDPYVSNPLRRPRVDHGLDQMADRDQWNRLCDILQDVQSCNDPVRTRLVFLQVLSAIRDRLREFTFSYVVPPRVSIRQAEDLVQRFLADRSGGDRILAITAALFKTFQGRLDIYQDVRRGVINASDAATNSVGDLECVGADGSILLAVEVKERRIGGADVHVAVAKAREFAVRELLFCTEGIRPCEQAVVERMFASAWASGTNLYHATIGELMRGALPLLGEAGIRDFVVQVGSQLDRFSTQPRHRIVWKSLVDDL